MEHDFLLDALLPDSSGGNSTIPGVTTGRVTKNWDKDHPGMVQVEISLGKDRVNVTRWVRVMQPYAAKESGNYFLPEVDSEVLIAFNMGNVDMPYVIGCLWNSKIPVPKQTADKDNSVKRIRTLGGNEIVFNDKKDKQTITVSTPKELQIIIDDGKDTISVKDKKGENIFTLNAQKGEITIKAKSKITLDAGGKAQIVLDGKAGKASVKATDVAVEAQKAVNIKSQQRSDSSTQYEVKANGMAKIQSSGMLQLKGSITKIN